MEKVFEGAKWISDGVAFDWEHNENDERALYFRKRFFIEDTAAAELYICGLGLYEAKINGKRVGDKVLDPAFTDYSKRVVYSRYAVSELLQQGENTIEAIVGNGWYNQTSHDAWKFWKKAWRDRCKLLAVLRIGEEKIVTDESWECGYGGIRSRLRGGERHDFRAETKYFSAKEAVAPQGVLEEEVMPPIRECEALKPIKEEKIGDRIRYDFGKTIAGYCSFFAQGERGQEVALEYADRLDEKGDADNTETGMYIANKTDVYQTDRCILSGGKDFFKPKFTYHGFRYAFVCADEGVKIENVTAYFAHTDLARRGKFSCGDEVLQALYEMSVRSILGNYHGFPTDCPQREKNGWTGDAYLSMETALYLFDMEEAYKKWIADMADTQTAEGALSCIAPSGTWYGCWPSWEIAFYGVAYALYYRYRDRETAKRFYPVMKKHFRFIVGTYLEDGLIPYGQGDMNWPSVEFEKCPQELTSSLNFMKIGELLAELAPISGEDGEEYSLVARGLRKRIAEKYANETSLTGMAGLTFYGVLDKTDEIVNYLQAHDYAMHCGMLGAKFLLGALAQKGRTEELYTLLTKTEYPSFGYWYASGMTTLAENFDMTGSLNHHIYAYLVEFAISTFVGVRMGKDNCVATIEPRLPKNLPFASYEWKDERGGLRARVERNGEKTRLSLGVFGNFIVAVKGKAYSCGEYVVEI